MVNTTRTAADLTATEMLDSYAGGELSPVEATEATLRRIDEADGAVNAFCLVDADRALEQARASERRWQRGEPVGRLDGVPTSVKDIFLTRDWPTLRGSRTVDPDQHWSVDAPTVARLREHNAVFVGKTTTPELAWKGVTDNTLNGITRNPWATTRTPGGSSGGAAAAVALGMAPLAIGTDGGGSVRIPASFCGIFTIKPTYGRVPHYPASPYGTMAHAGPMTTTVAETALMMDVLSEPDSRDWSALQPMTTSFLDGLDDGVRGLRIALSPGLGFATVDPEIAKSVSAAAKVFTDLGAIVEDADPGITDPVEDFHVLWFSGAAKSVEHLTAEQRELLDPGLHEIVSQGLTYSAQDYLEATNTRMLLGQRMGAFHDTYDLLLTATVPIPPFEAGVEVPPGWPQPRWTSWTPLTYPFNMTQQPAASVPCGFTAEGLPIGLQIVGPRHSDARVLRAARAFEQARPWSRPAR
ncbi:aspartyl-tRNA(Asn)/glutamyl-tRNA(Gln) amidotransferase subunit A [Saccharopolyspora erythraea NRRL 2338]|uniref:Amidase n=2 Tax=Saccharopolyspora erythraea TaxID=1836 RepID=A4FG69_SACEN|nr:amidase [Saccharopolyspora erythraea]EQD82321.1 amidase [Saccharopolyspora erythraea D]PFG96749.1 aspartyl-tRNA(Asn)/glutamyl-tRNA(Gln) amidotransferase subunit A [Saccharopolyspora erythraea NRRL 2338]QRK86999.1 amidase [Saccharopolyspora erythraea]CAM03044.1 amidase [Saccharopolyspora erythraea NRRL 2338]